MPTPLACTRRCALPVILLLLLILLGAATTALAEPVFFPRRPAISPTGETVVFSYQGDLWSVSADGGSARRLTAHPAYDRDAVFSPDGQRIAFASDRHGQFDLFVMAAGGGLPQRLTYAMTPDFPQDWSQDGQEVLFSARRPWHYPVLAQIQTIAAEGGTPRRLTDFFAGEIAVGPVSPDGQSYLLAIGDNRFGRVGYRGTLQSDIWLWRPGTDPVQLTTSPGYDTDPMWGPDGRSVFYRAEDDETQAFNIWRMRPDGTAPQRLTDFRDTGVRNGRISRDGTRIVFEVDTDIYVLDTRPGAEARRLEITVAADVIENEVTVENVTKSATEIAVADDGEEIALIVRGEIVLVNRELEGRATVPVPGPWRERDISFRPGGADTLVFVTDRQTDDGLHYNRIGILVSADPDQSLLRLARHHRIEFLTPPGIEASDPNYAPAGDRIAYLHGKGQLHVMDHDGGHDRRLVDHWNDPDFTWSPDGHWLAYAVYDPDYNQDIWIIPSAGNAEPVNISQHPDDDSGPVWNESGSMLAWSSRRYGNQYDVLFCYLSRADDERTREEWEIWEKTREKDKDKDKDKEKDENGSEDDAHAEGDEDGDEPPPPLQIDFEDIHLRSRRATNLPGPDRVVALHPEGDLIAFAATVAGERDLYTVNRFGEELEALTKKGVKPTDEQLGADGETIWFLKSGQPARVPLKGGEVEVTSFRARLAVDKPAQREQIVEEGWRVLRDRFYDPQLHGVDWPGARERALTMAAGVYHDADFADAMNVALPECLAHGLLPGGGTLGPYARLARPELRSRAS